jgi:hypothetical protein
MLLKESLFLKGVNMFKIKLYIAEVVDNDDQNSDDGEKLGRIKVKLLPEMKDLKDSNLPWVRPFFQIGMSSSQFSYSSPEVGDRVWVFYIDEYLKNGYYLWGSFIDGFFDFSTISDELGNIAESPDTTYPNLKFFYIPDGSILFWNTDTGDKGVYNSNGSYIFISADGQIYIYSKDQEMKVYNDNLSFELNDDGTYKIDGEGTIECKSGGQVDINGNLTVDK